MIIQPLHSGATKWLWIYQPRIVSCKVPFASILASSFYHRYHHGAKQQANLNIVAVVVYTQIESSHHQSNRRTLDPPTFPSLSIRQPTNKRTNQPTDRSIDQSINQTKLIEYERS